MAGQEQLKKRLRSVMLSGQLAGAMKTAASAKYAKLSRLFSMYEAYTDELVHFSEHQRPQKEQLEADCYVILGHNRGLCGGYNTELHHFARDLLENKTAPIMVTGKKAAAHFPTAQAFIFPDIPTREDCAPFFQTLLPYYMNGRIVLIYQSFVNTLTQKPVAMELAPPALCFDEEKKNNLLLIPDLQSVEEALHLNMYESVMYRSVLEAALSAQAATLMAMRTAYDNARETADELQNEINKKRQGTVTAGVLETSSAMAAEWEEQHESK